MSMSAEGGAENPSWSRATNGQFAAIWPSDRHCSFLGFNAEYCQE